MTVGSVEADGDVRVRVTVEGSDGGLRTVEAVLDTGFNGFLTLSAAELAALGLRRKSETRVQLADGERYPVSTYQAPVALGEDESPRSVVDIFEAGEALVGAGLLWDCDLHIRYVAGGRVEIEAIP